MSVSVGMRVRCAFGQGIVEKVDTEKKLVTIKLESGRTVIVNPQEIEKSVNLGPAKAVSHSVTVTESATGATKVTKTVTTMGSGGSTTTTTVKTVTKEE